MTELPATPHEILEAIASSVDRLDLKHGWTGKTVQNELRIISAWLSAHPDAEQQIMTLIELDARE